MTESDFPEINQIDKKLEDLNQQSCSIGKEKKSLKKRREQLEDEMETLIDWIWKTKNPTVVELRRELLMAARLAYDEDEVIEQEEPTTTTTNTKQKHTTWNISDITQILNDYRSVLPQDRSPYDDQLWYSSNIKFPKG